MNDKDLMPFGKYKDEKIGDVDAGYLLWLGDQDLTRYPELRAYIDLHREMLEQEKKHGR